MLENFIQKRESSTCNVIAVEFAAQVTQIPLSKLSTDAFKDDSVTNRFVQVFHGLLASLVHLDSRGILHRVTLPRALLRIHLQCEHLSRAPQDIKGDNVLVTTAERDGSKEVVVKLIDFGCAKKPGVDDDGVVFDFIRALCNLLLICGISMQMPVL
jgi:serine/threonine protein kinase